jgi:hypothetical protein
MFGETVPRPTRYRGVATHSTYVTMADGVKLAVEVSLPANLPPEDRIPALLQQTRYWRAIELRPPLGWVFEPNDLFRKLKPMRAFFIERGYALVTVAVRGTGASFGACPYPWPEDSLRDAGEIVDWITAQPWSNGRVGGTGVSYLGTTADLLAVTNRPAVRAILAMFNHPDAFLDIAFPGGILNRHFIEAWSAANLAQDKNELPDLFGRLARLAVKGVKPVDGPDGRRLLAEATVCHANNGDVYGIARRITYRDDLDETLDVSLDRLSAYRRWGEIERSGIPLMGWGSWMDAGTGDAVLRRYCSLDNARQAVIGAWDHGGLTNASPYRRRRAPVGPPLQAQWAEAAGFFDAYLPDDATGRGAERVLHFYTLGAERWQQTDVWPPRGTAMQRWYLAADGQLARSAPEDEAGADMYTVDWEATTGPANRWWEMSGAMRQEITYRHRAEAARHMLTYTSPPLDRDTEIAGHPVVTLYVSSTEPDCAFYAYLEDVDEQGHVTYVTDGQLRAIHRALSPDPAPYGLDLPHHSLAAADALPLVPGEVAEIRFALLPTSALIRRGHRLRLGIAGHDKDTFVRIPETGTPVWTVARNRVQASTIEVPVRNSD